MGCSNTLLVCETCTSKTVFFSWMPREQQTLYLNVDHLKRLGDCVVDIITRGLTLQKAQDAGLIQHDSLSG